MPASIAQDPRYFDYMMTAVFLKPWDHTGDQHHQALNHMAVLKDKYAVFVHREVDTYALLGRSQGSFVEGVRGMVDLRKSLQIKLVLQYSADAVPHKSIINEPLFSTQAVYLLPDIHGVDTAHPTNPTGAIINANSTNTPLGLGVSAGDTLEIAKELGRGCIDGITSISGMQDIIASAATAGYAVKTCGGNPVLVGSAAATAGSITGAKVCYTGAKDRVGGNVLRCGHLTACPDTSSQGGGGTASVSDSMGIHSTGSVSFSASNDVQVIGGNINHDSSGGGGGGSDGGCVIC